MEIKHIEDKGFFISDEKGEVIAELTYKKEAIFRPYICFKINERSGNC